MNTCDFSKLPNTTADNSEKIKRSETMLMSQEACPFENKIRYK